MNQKLAVGLLEVHGHRISLAQNGKEAVAAWESRPFDLVLMDLQMPELDGFGATRRLRAAGFTAPIVALTGNALESERHRCREEGFDDFTTKPVRKENLLDILRNHLSDFWWNGNAINLCRFGLQLAVGYGSPFRVKCRMCLPVDLK